MTRDPSKILAGREDPTAKIPSKMLAADATVISVAEYKVRRPQKKRAPTKTQKKTAQNCANTSSEWRKLGK